MKTLAGHIGDNLFFIDRDYSRTQGLCLLNRAPLLAMLHDPATGHHYFDHFHRYNSGEWTVTQVQGTGTAATQDAIGGVLGIVNSGTDDDETQLQKKGEAFKLASGKLLWFETKLYTTTADDCDLYVGLGITDTSSIGGASDGVTFRVTDTSANVQFVTEKNSTETTTSAITTLADATYKYLGFIFDGTNVYPYVNGVVGTAHTTNIPDDEELCVTFAVRNGSGAAKGLYIDYISVAQVF